MLLFQILTALWDRPGTGDEIAKAVEAHYGRAFPGHAVEHHVELLHGCGYLRAAGDSTSPQYTLTPDGSALLARMAEAFEHTEHASYELFS